MNHLIDIIDALDTLHLAGEEAVLVTVVKVEGSAYRQPGARMLIRADGQAVGMVSGGCLEKHLVKKAFWLTREGACVQRYHSSTDAEDESEQESFGLGCNGTIEVLFERITSPYFLALQDALQKLRQTKQPQILRTVIASNHPNLDIGARITDEQNLSQAAVCTLREPASRKSVATIDTYQAGAYTYQVVSEMLQPPPHLLVFGAGQDSLPLLEMAKLQGWVTTLIDSRADSIRLAKQRIIQADTTLHLPIQHAEQVQPLLTAYPHTAVAIMTHSVTQDKTWLKQALSVTSPAPFYIGQLGPRYRTQQLLADIGIADIPPQLFYPMGLPLGGDTPEAVALSTVAQIQAILSQVILKSNY